MDMTASHSLAVKKKYEVHLHNGNMVPVEAEIIGYDDRGCLVFGTMVPKIATPKDQTTETMKTLYTFAQWDYFKQL